MSRTQHSDCRTCGARTSYRRARFQTCRFRIEGTAERNQPEFRSLRDMWKNGIEVGPRRKHRAWRTRSSTLQISPFAVRSVDPTRIEAGSLEACIDVRCQHKVIHLVDEVEQMSVAVALVRSELPAHIVHVLRIQGPLGSPRYRRVGFQSHSLIASAENPFREARIGLRKVLWIRRVSPCLLRVERR